MNWEMHRRAGLDVEAIGPVIKGQNAVLHLKIGPWLLRAPVRIVEVVDQPSVGGFAYETLPGHPERGEERFLVSIDDQSVVWGEIRAFSRPGSWLTWLAGPIGRHLQSRISRRYLQALTTADKSPETDPAVSG